MLQHVDGVYMAAERRGHDFFMNLVLPTQCLIIMSDLKMSLEGWVILILFLLAEILSLLARLTA